MPETQVKLATSKKTIKFMGGEYNTLLVGGKVFFIATEINNLLGVGNIHQFVLNHSYGAERCKVHIGDRANRQRLAISTNAMRRFAKKLERPNLIELALKGECEFNMPYPRSVSKKHTTVKPTSEKAHVDVAKNKKADEIERRVIAGMNFVDKVKLQREIADLKNELAKQERINESLSKLVPKPAGYSVLLERASKWNMTAKTTAQVAADYGYSLEDFQAKLIELDIVQGTPVSARVTALSDDSHLFSAGYLKKYPKIAIEPLWTIDGQQMLYTALGAKDVVPLIDKLNDIETVYNISI